MDVSIMHKGNWRAVLTRLSKTEEYVIQVKNRDRASHAMIDAGTRHAANVHRRASPQLLQHPRAGFRVV